MNNIDIRDAIKSYGVYGYEVASRLGISETHFSRKLRKELSDDDKEKIMSVIMEINAQRKRS